MRLHSVRIHSMSPNLSHPTRAVCCLEAHALKSNGCTGQTIPLTIRLTIRGLCAELMVGAPDCISNTPVNAMILRLMEIDADTKNKLSSCLMWFYAAKFMVNNRINKSDRRTSQPRRFFAPISKMQRTFTEDLCWRPFTREHWLKSIY